MSAVTKAFDVDELLFEILQHLDRNSLAKCARVNTQWHVHAISFLWGSSFDAEKEKALRQLTKYPERLRHYMPCIKSLKIRVMGWEKGFRPQEDDFWCHWADPNVNRLCDVHFLPYAIHSDVSLYTHFFGPRLRSLAIGGVPLNLDITKVLHKLQLRALALYSCDSISNEFCKAMLESQTQLLLLTLTLSTDCASIFEVTDFMVSASRHSKLEHIKLGFTASSIPTRRLVSTSSLSIRALDMNFLGLSALTNWVAHMPNLSALRVYTDRPLNDGEFDAAAVFLVLTSNCPLLEELDFLGYEPTSAGFDKALRDLVQTTPHLRSLRLNVFSHMDDELELPVTAVNLTGAISVATFQTMASSCPNLEQLCCRQPCQETGDVDSSALVFDALLIGCPRLRTLQLQCRLPGIDYFRAHMNGPNHDHLCLVEFRRPVYYGGDGQEQDGEPATTVVNLVQDFIQRRLSKIETVRWNRRGRGRDVVLTGTDAYEAHVLPWSVRDRIERKAIYGTG